MGETNFVIEEITESCLFDLHRAVQSEFIADIYKPYGAWKVEPNGTYAVTEDGRQTYIEYAAPGHVPTLIGAVTGGIESVDQYGAIRNRSDQRPCRVAPKYC